MCSPTSTSIPGMASTVTLRGRNALATSNPQTSTQGEMLWVYEGLTQYYRNVLAARSGLWTPQRYADTLAQAAANLDPRPVAAGVR